MTAIFAQLPPYREVAELFAILLRREIFQLIQDRKSLSGGLVGLPVKAVLRLLRGKRQLIPEVSTPFVSSYPLLLIGQTHTKR
jgi:hypothetical protein